MPRPTINVDGVATTALINAGQQTKRTMADQPTEKSRHRAGRIARLAAVIVLALNVLPVSAQIGSPVHTEWRGGSTGSQSPSSVDSATGSKNFYVVHCGSINGGGQVSITDTVGSTYNVLTKQGGDGTSQIFWVSNAATSGTLKWTSSCSGGCYPSCQGYAFSGVATSQGTVSENGGVSGTGATSGSPGSVTVASTNDLVITGIGLGANTDTPTMTNYTVNGLNYDGSTSYNGFSGWALRPSGTETPTWNWTTGSTTEGMTIATFIAAGGGGGGSVKPWWLYRMLDVAMVIISTGFGYVHYRVQQLREQARRIAELEAVMEQIRLWNALDQAKARTL